MRVRILIALTCVAICGVLTACAPSVAPEGQSEQLKNDKLIALAQKDPVTSDRCITCHPFDEIERATNDYVDPELGKVNPHMLVDEETQSNPHESPNAVPPDCSTCHTTNHAVDDNGNAIGVELPRGLTGCYTSCHHTQTFEACTQCHGSLYYAQ